MEYRTGEETLESTDYAYLVVGIVYVTSQLALLAAKS
jgi:hypothetical protein